MCLLLFVLFFLFFLAPSRIYSNQHCYGTETQTTHQAILGAAQVSRAPASAVFPASNFEYHLFIFKEHTSSCTEGRAGRRHAVLPLPPLAA